MNHVAERIRVLALIPPIEQYVGHWASSSPSVDLVRVIMEGDNVEDRIRQAVRAHDPCVIAIIGKYAVEYLNLLDRLAEQTPQLRDLPRVYRCQNTSFAHRDIAPNRRVMAEMSGWFDRACDPRWALVLVQTLDDVEAIRQALAPVRVVWCPYGYDTAVFDPHAAEFERVTDVGCYFNLRGDAQRIRLVEETERICKRRGWAFHFVEGKYWHEYARQIRSTKICLHRSIYQEVPYRMYETMALGSLLVSDPLRYSVDKLFELGTEYLTYRPDYCDLEEVLEGLLSNPHRWDAIRQAGKKRAMTYTWTQIAEQYVAPALRSLVQATYTDERLDSPLHSLGEPETCVTTGRTR